jgi:gamma-glutamylcyclotransferase (GGCT)/AIG2-like uncharacterized protein YtfP
MNDGTSDSVANASGLILSSPPGLCAVPRPDTLSAVARSMTHRLFVYGTLAPGRPNEHVLADLAGTWEPASVLGTLIPKGSGAAAGYPGIILDEHGSEVEGFLFSAESLAEHWTRLDEFEGEGYERVLTTAKLNDGRTVEAYVYRLSGNRLRLSSTGDS